MTLPAAGDKVTGQVIRRQPQ